MKTNYLQEEFVGVVVWVDGLAGRNSPFEACEAGRHPVKERRGRCGGVVESIVPDLTGFIVQNVNRTSMNGAILDQSRFCENLSGLWLE